MFKVGDRVQYKNQHPIGVGTVVSISPQFKVNFDHCESCDRYDGEIIYDANQSLELVPAPESKYIINEAALGQAELLIRREIENLPGSWDKTKDLLEQAAHNLYEVLRSV